jgi:hypothetical protein
VTVVVKYVKLGHSAIQILVLLIKLCWNDSIDCDRSAPSCSYDGYILGESHGYHKEADKIVEKHLDLFEQLYCLINLIDRILANSILYYAI